MSERSNDEIKQAVRDRYAGIARGEAQSCCGGEAPSRAKGVVECCSEAGATSCCSQDEGDSCCSEPSVVEYSAEELKSLPEGAELGLGCGNPQAIAALKTGEVVLDLGSGGGVDCFLAAKKVGESGRAIGVDMTPDMISRARANAERAGYDNVEFRLGEIENIPVADSTVDAIISNCVINLSPDKPAVYGEAFRVLKPGGRLAISDVVASGPIPDAVKDDLALHAGCIAGAETPANVESMLAEAGFEDIRVVTIEGSRRLISQWAPGSGAEDYVISAAIEAVKPG